MPVRRLALLGFLACARARDSTHHHHGDDRAARLGDGCYHVFLDVGSNRGVHGRFFFEPEKYPRSKFAKRFQSILPDTGKRRKTSCVFAFEPNPLHAPTQKQTTRKYRAMGWRYTYVGAAASDQQGNLTFWQNNGFYGTGKSATSFARLEVGFSTQNRDPGNPHNQRVDVPTIDLSAWIRHHILERRIPEDGDLYDAKSPPLLIMKMDIEGSEYRTFSKMVLDRVACSLDYIYGETHAFTNRFEKFQLRNNVVLDGAQARAFMWSLNMMLRMEGCKTTWIEFDDEAYHADGVEYPKPPR